MPPDYFSNYGIQEMAWGNFTVIKQKFKNFLYTNLYRAVIEIHDQSNAELLPVLRV